MTKKEKRLQEIQQGNIRRRQLMAQICKDGGHEIDYYFKDGTETVFCYQCNDFRKHAGQMFFGGMKRYLDNNQN